MSNPEPITLTWLNELEQEALSVMFDSGPRGLYGHGIAAHVERLLPIVRAALAVDEDVQMEPGYTVRPHVYSLMALHEALHGTPQEVNNAGTT